MAEVSPPDPHSPRFQLGSAQLEALVESKDTRTLLSYGGASGLVRALDSSAEYGLSVNGTQPEISRWAQGSPQTLTSTIPDSPTAPQPPVAASPSKPSPARASNHLRADIEDQIHCQFAERIAHYGTNFLPEVQIKSLWRLAWEAVQEKIIIVLCIAAALSLALGIYEDVTNENPDEPKVSWVEGFAIIVAILIVIFAGSINDYQKERQFQQLNAKKEDRQVKVRRNGGTMFISVYAVQVGDVLTVESGDIMCADALVLPGSSGISCDESTVTGESDPIRKAALDVSSAPSTSREVAVAPNLDGIDPFLISGSKVIAGVGTCLVIAVGPNSFYGRTLLSLRTENQPTPLQIKLNRLADHISKLGLLAAVLMLIALLIRYFVNFAQHPESRGSATTIVNAIVRIVITTVTIVVVAVPEGLPLAVTLALAFATTRMVYDNCLVRVLASCETMGNATTICSDKTGTLTENKMTVIAGTLGDSYRFTSTRTTVGLDLASIGKKKKNPKSANSKHRKGERGSKKRAHHRVRDWMQQAHHDRSDPALHGTSGAPPSSVYEGASHSLAVPDVKIVITEADQLDDFPSPSDAISGWPVDGGSDNDAPPSHYLPPPASPSVDGRLSMSSDDCSSQTSRHGVGVMSISEVSQRVPGRVLALVHEALSLNSTAFENTQSELEVEDKLHESTPLMAQPVPGHDASSSPLLWGRFTKLLKGGSKDKSTDPMVITAPPEPFKGPPTEKALLQWARDSGSSSIQSIRDSVETIKIWSFDSNKKRMTVLVKYVRKNDTSGSQDTYYRLYVKGAPELVLTKCSHLLHAPVPLDCHRSYSGNHSGHPLHTPSQSDFGSVPPSPTASFSRSPQPPAAWSLRAPTPGFPDNGDDHSTTPFLTVSPPEPDDPIFRLGGATPPPPWSAGDDGSDGSALNPSSYSPPASRSPQFLSPQFLSPSPTGLTLTIPTPVIGGNTMNRAGSEELLQVGSSIRPSTPNSPSRANSVTPSGSDRSFIFPASRTDIPTIPMSSHWSQEIVNTISEYSNKSLRTIGVAYREFTDYDEALFTADQDDALVDQLTWLGLFGIEDPLRPGVTESVAMCRQAGVMVRMVTGDNVLTARSIAIQCGIYEPGSGGIIMEGPQFRKLSDEEMEFIAPRLQVLARSSPEDKKTLVNWLQKAKEVVAVTGDGTNDGPALKSADIGFSMGITGTEVAKEASSIILMDDNFASIVKATMWGRSVNDSVKKFLQFQLTVNITAVLLAFVTAVSDSNQASVLTAVQLLWVNLIMDTLAALALATDQPTTALLQRPPDKFGGALVNLSMWKIIIGQSLFQITICLVLYYIGDQIFDLDLAMPEERLVHRTLIFNTFVWMQIFNEINARVLDTQLNVFHRIHKNWYFLIIFIVIAFLQVIIVEFGDVAFKTTHQEWYLWLTAVIIGLFSLPIGVLIKLIPDQWLGWLPSSITDNYHHPRDLTWKSPVDSVYTQIQNHPMFSGRSHTSLAGKSSFQSEKVTKSAIALTPMGSPGLVMSPSTGGEVPVLVLPEPAVNHGLAPPTGDSSPSRSSRGSFSFRRGKSAAGLTSAAVMIPAFTLTSVAVNNEMIKAQASPIKDDIYIPTSRDENH
ncbi:plasma membrane calcium [Dimargaris cristalligena]|nr:plasma membrane calcium [Dimargaris cristalligena]